MQLQLRKFGIHDVSANKKSDGKFGAENLVTTTYDNTFTVGIHEKSSQSDNISDPSCSQSMVSFHIKLLINP